MKSKLLSAIALPAMIAVGCASAIAQDTKPSPTTPAPSPSPSTPLERSPDVTPSPSTATPSPSTTSPSTTQTTQMGQEWRSSKLVGMAVYNRANERVGDINDLIVAADGKVARAVIGVGGFLGIGEKLVAIDFTDIQLNRDADGKMRAVVNSTKESLESAPDFKYAQ